MMLLEKMYPQINKDSLDIRMGNGARTSLSEGRDLPILTLMSRRNLTVL